MSEQIRRESAPEEALAFERVSRSYVRATNRLLARFHGDWSEDEMAEVERVLLERQMREQETTHWVLCKFDAMDREPYRGRLASWGFWHYRRGSVQALAHAIRTNSPWIDTPPEERTFVNRYETMGREA